MYCGVLLQRESQGILRPRCELEHKLKLLLRCTPRGACFERPISRFSFEPGTLEMRWLQTESLHPEIRKRFQVMQVSVQPAQLSLGNSDSSAPPVLHPMKLHTNKTTCGCAHSFAGPPYPGGGAHLQALQALRWRQRENCFRRGRWGPLANSSSSVVQEPVCFDLFSDQSRTCYYCSSFSYMVYQIAHACGSAVCHGLHAQLFTFMKVPPSCNSCHSLEFRRWRRWRSTPKRWGPSNT